MTSTTLFPNECDGEIADKITKGFRPEWPSSNPSQKLVDALREHVEACWKKEPGERPTALEVLQTLLTLGEGRRQELVVSGEDPEDDEAMREWEQVRSTPELSTLVLVVANKGTHIWLIFSRLEPQRAQGSLNLT